GLALSVPLVGSRLWASVIAMLVVAAGLAAAVAVRLAGRARQVRMNAAWNCGRIVQSPRSEYTAAAFAEPLKRVFTGFYRPTQEVTVKVHPTSHYFVRSMAYHTGMVPWMEHAIYGPLIGLTRRASVWILKRQTGSIHFYLALLPAALLLLLVVSRWIR